MYGNTESLTTEKRESRKVLVTNRFDSDNIQQPFDVYNQGEELWAFEGEEFYDRIRWFAEDCDQMRGFNIVADVANGFSGFTSKCMEFLADEYRGKASVVWCLLDAPCNEKAAVYRSANTIMGYHKLQELADLIIPLAVTIDGIGRDLRRSSIPLDLSSFTGGAALSLHMDSILASLKLKSDNAFDFSTFPKVIAEGQRKFAVSSMITQPTKESKMESFTPKCVVPKHSVGTFVVLRASDELQQNVAKICGSNPASTYCTQITHPTKFLEDRFPQIAPGAVIKGSGLLSGVYAVQNSETILTHFDDLMKKKFSLNKMHRLTVSKDDVDEAVHGLARMREHYIS